MSRAGEIVPIESAPTLTVLPFLAYDHLVANTLIATGLLSTGERLDRVLRMGTRR